MISLICELFTCTPLEAAQQDFSLVKAVIEYRSILEVNKSPDDVVNEDGTPKFTSEQIKLYKEMRDGERG